LVKTGFGIRYPGHDWAVDAYIGDTQDEGEWGIHWGHDAYAPADGFSTIYSFPTPLLPHMAMGATHPDGVGDLAARLYYEQHAQLFAAIGEPGACYFAGNGKVGAQTMFFALLTFDTPQRLPNGVIAKAIWLGHVRGDIATGHLVKGQRWCTLWNSGINFEAAGIPALASHAHTCGTATGQLTMNGDVDGYAVAEFLGWTLHNAGVSGPGPDHYMTGQYRAGKHVSLWTGHALPPGPSSSLAADIAAVGVEQFVRNLGATSAALNEVGRPK
jgi:hypothetical protein